MRDPFRIEGPATISFSGGRTSGYMLWRILQAWGGDLPPDVRVCFANTGKEMPQTLDFVRDCELAWGCPIHWLEYRSRNQFAEVSWLDASRQGEPFDQLIRDKNILPNPIMRFCTQELKIRTIARFMESIGISDFVRVIGIRADEPSRVVKLRGQDDVALPLAAAGITRAYVAEFWSAQNWGLKLPYGKPGETPLSNCDLCFLKPASKLMGIIRENPGLAVWWAGHEQRQAARPDKQLMLNKSQLQWRQDRPSYAAMLDAVQRQGNIDFGDLDQRIDCFCSEDQA
jgi:hypothetical protein